MTVVPDLFDPDPEPSTATIITIAAAPAGWWWLHYPVEPRFDGEEVTYRRPVAGWATMSDGSIQPLIARGTKLALAANDACPEDRLWSDGESVCTCSTAPRNHWGDPWWCEICAGVIDPRLDPDQW